MDCLQGIAQTDESSLGFDRNNPTSWGAFDSWDHLCGAVTAQFATVMCMMCATEEFPGIQDTCNPNDRRLSEDSWNLFNGYKNERRRLNLQEQNTEESPPKDKKRANKNGRELPTCLIEKAVVAYPTTAETAYVALVGPLLVPFVLDVTGVDLSLIDFGDDDEVPTTGRPDNPAGTVGVSPILTLTGNQFKVRTNQVSGALLLLPSRLININFKSSKVCGYFYLFPMCRTS